MAHVAPEQVRPDRADLTHRFRDLYQATEIAQCHPSGLDARDTAGHVRRDLLIEVKAQLVVDFAVDFPPFHDSAHIGHESSEHAEAPR
jgi:hypothetical protein